MTLSSLGINELKVLRKVVLPLPVPPHRNTVFLFLTHSHRNLAASSLINPCLISETISWEIPVNFLIVTIGPSGATGGSTAFAQEPSGSLRSDMGLASLRGLF